MTNNKVVRKFFVLVLAVLACSTFFSSAAFAAMNFDTTVTSQYPPEIQGALQYLPEQLTLRIHTANGVENKVYESKDLLKNMYIVGDSAKFFNMKGSANKQYAAKIKGALLLTARWDPQSKALEVPSGEITVFLLTQNVNAEMTDFTLEDKERIWASLMYHEMFHVVEHIVGGSFPHSSIVEQELKMTEPWRSQGLLSPAAAKFVADTHILEERLKHEEATRLTASR